jgi:hypothetical protein
MSVCVGKGVVSPWSRLGHQISGIQGHTILVNGIRCHAIKVNSLRCQLNATVYRSTSALCSSITSNSSFNEKGMIPGLLLSPNTVWVCDAISFERVHIEVLEPCLTP